MPHPTSSLRLPTLLLTAALTTACSRGDASVTTAHAEGESARSALRPPSDVRLPDIAAPAEHYAVQPVADGGVVAGTVQVDGAAPTDSVIVTPEEIRAQCGASFPDRTLSLRGPQLGGAVVWLEGVRHGKALPAVRRHEVSITGCRLEPRAQAVFAGGTLHVHSEDRLKSLVRVLRWPGGEVAATVTTNDDGEVVPDDRVLAKVGTLELKGAQPAWLRAWVLVFDHPYAATTADAGTFSLDSVPPGQYTLVAWHERFGRVAQPVTVAAGQSVNVTLRFGAPNATASPAGGAPVGAPADTAVRGSDTARPVPRGR